MWRREVQHGCSFICQYAARNAVQHVLHTVSCGTLHRLRTFIFFSLAFRSANLRTHLQVIIDLESQIKANSLTDFFHLTCENPVDWRSVHLFSGENDDVEDVSDGAEDADHQRKVAVDLAGVSLLEVPEKSIRKITILYVGHSQGNSEVGSKYLIN